MTAAPAPYHRSCIIPCMCLLFVLLMHFGNFFFVVSALMGWELGRTGSNPRSCQRLHPRSLGQYALHGCYLASLWHCAVWYDQVGKALWLGGRRWVVWEANKRKATSAFCWILLSRKRGCSAIICIIWTQILKSGGEKYSSPYLRNTPTLPHVIEENWYSLRCMYIRPLHSRLIWYATTNVGARPLS